MVKIISDSSTLYSVEQAREKNLEITPLAVTINGQTYKEFEEIQTKEFIDMIHEGHLPISSQPSIGEVVDTFNRYPDTEIINISMADGLSGTYNSACMAKGMVDHEDKITVINSRTLCGPQRYIVDTAVELANEGKTKDEIVSVVEGLIDTTISFLIPNDFEYLVRGGRLSPLAGRIGELVKLVPVMTQTADGTRLEKFATKRTMKKAMATICDAFIEAGVNENYKIYITHAYNEEAAIVAKDIISKNIENVDVEMKILSPAFTTQGGPKCIAVQAVKKYEVK